VGRYFPPPAEYHPGLVLYGRERVEGGGVPAAVVQRPPWDQFGVREAVVLVHGYNNHYGEAATAYFGFRRRQYDADTQIQAGSLERMLVDMFWPGDGDWGIADPGDFLIYPFAVGRARDISVLLARAFQAMPQLLRLDFLGHSLGCRVVLETIRELMGLGAQRVGRVCLMAAAVPVFKVESGGDLADAIAGAQRVLVLYSEKDAVLRWAFRAGQTVASGREGFMPVALGAKGPPRTMPGIVSSLEITGAGHSDYWGHKQGGASGGATQPVKDFFQFGERVRTISARRGIAPSSVPPSRSLSKPVRAAGTSRRVKAR
jgi:hypothetical protein